MKVLLVFPHQLFESNAQLAEAVKTVCLIEDPLFFVQYRFHKQKLVLHRASMHAHADFLRSRGRQVDYIPFAAVPTMQALFDYLKEQQVDNAYYIDVVDDWLERRLTRAGEQSQIVLTRHASPMFISDDALLSKHFDQGKNSRMAQFYKDQRLRTRLLMDGASPVGGRWSFDEENRKRLPKNHPVPPSGRAPMNPFVEEAQRYIDAHFVENPGSVEPFVYPVTYADAKAWLENFIENRLAEFGAYEDAISEQHDVLFHSLLTPSLNIGLLTPAQVIEAVLSRAEHIPLNSLEGFIRQIIGWREYMRGAYQSSGRQLRSRNVWNHTRAIPKAFWSGTTSIVPIDKTIQKLLRGAYAHHIERLMILTNFMLLCEFHPDQVYEWFMEMFIDAYDWVMVPNVYAMALYADGGSITTKPYISGSNYILKMSDFKRGPWCDIWDGLYWRFIAKHREEFSLNQRTKVLVMGLDRLSAEKRALHAQTADKFLLSLSP